MRIILYTGKGGVGKTSIAAATACKIARSGKKVLIMSTDEAHSLSDSFGVKLGNEAVEIEEHLMGMEIDTVIENEKAWGRIKDYLEKLLTLTNQKSIETEELLVFPGFSELLALLKIKTIYEAGEVDVLIVDCAPTGETMSLLKFPEVFKWWMEKLFPMKRKATKVMGPMVEAVTKLPMPSDEVFDDIDKLYKEVQGLQQLLLNKEVVSIRIVTTPEKIVVKEAKRSFSFLHLFDYNVDALIVNKIFPKAALEGYFDNWSNFQKESMQDIEESFRGLPILELELMPEELRQTDRLNEVAEKLFRGIQPEAILFSEKIFEVQKMEGGYFLGIHIPFVDKRELNLTQQGDEVTLAIKNEKRNFILPPKLQGQEITGAKYEGGQLKVFFS